MLTCLSLALLSAAPNAHAGTYSAPASSGGTWTQNDPANPASGSYSLSGGGYGASLDDKPTSGSLSCQGIIKAVFTWQPAYPGEPPPASVIVMQTSGASVTTTSTLGVTGNQVTDGLGKSDPWNVGETQYTVVTGGNTITLNTCNPSALISTSQKHELTASVGYTATVYPVIITPSGAVKDTSGNWNILVGQGCTASLSGIPAALLNNTANLPKYQWPVSGTTFQDWESTTPAFPNASPPTQANSNASYYDPGPGVQTNPTYHWYWNDPAQTTKTVTCTATVTPPAGQGSSFSVTATQKVTVHVPTVGTHTNSVGLGYVASAQSGNQTVTGMVATPTPAMRNNAQEYGSSWTTSVSLPTTPAFGAGQWGYAQLITPGEYLTGGNGVQTPSTHTTRGDGLDALFPYSALQPTDGNPYHDGDSPSLAGLNVSVASAKLLDYFRTYLMFKPPGSDVRWVPLAESLWATNFNASIPASGSWLDFPASQSVGPVTLTNDFMLKNEFPRWSQIVLSNQPFIHN